MTVRVTICFAGFADTLFSGVPSGAWEDCSVVKPMFRNVPARVRARDRSHAPPPPFPLFSLAVLPSFFSSPQMDSFVERRVEMFEIMSLLHFNRLVTIRGPPGIGKTSIATQLCHRVRLFD